MILYDFTTQSNLSDWRVVDDGVMGGRSQGNFKIKEEGHAQYSGYVSLANNGGFSSVRYRFESKNISEYSHVAIRLKGDGNRYQFRKKNKVDDRHSYIHYFETTGAWQTVQMKLSDFYPAFRGRTLDIPNYPGETMEEIAFLIGNKKEQSFQLVLDKITLLQ